MARATRIPRGDDRTADDNAIMEQAAPTAARERALRGRGFVRIAGVDEAGRGCLAGPVVAGAVVLKPAAWEMPGRLAEVRDSKLLAPAVREQLLEVIREYAVAMGVGVAPVEAIERGGIVAATKLAMHRAIAGLRVKTDFLLIDYLTLPGLPTPQEGIVHGDALCLSIAAASIVAKVSRDRLLVELDQRHPGYGFAQHKGYGTPQHLAALARLGPCKLHRRTFAPVRALLDGTEWRGGATAKGGRARLPRSEG